MLLSTNYSWWSDVNRRTGTLYTPPTMDKDQDIVINLSGRGDKDILTVAEIDGIHF